MDARESVARAICIGCEENPDHRGDAGGNEKRWQDYLTIADAAISALSGEGVLVRLDRHEGYEDTHPQLGLSAEQSLALREQIKRGSGLNLVCGSHGSGRSTFLQTLAAEVFLHNSASKILSLETPVAYPMPWAEQRDCVAGRQDTNPAYIGNIDILLLGAVDHDLDLSRMTMAKRQVSLGRQVWVAAWSSGEQRSKDIAFLFADGIALHIEKRLPGTHRYTIIEKE